MNPRIGVLSYGSLIECPGSELEEAEIGRRSGIRTPFRVEFARSSSGRGGAPTLVPVIRGGAHVESTIIVLRNGLSLQQARDRVYRREKGAVGDLSQRYDPDPDKQNQVWVELLPGMAGLDWVLYTRIAANIDERTPERLAELAVSSARGSVGQQENDGISYLSDALSNGIQTPLVEEYRMAVLDKIGASSLEEAWERVRAG